MRRSAIEWALTAVVVAGLAIDAYVHLHVAGDYRLVRTSVVSQATLFRIEGTVAALAALWVLLRASLWSALAAFLVAAGGVGALTFYYYVDPGRLGPLPDMYEPVWFADKTWTFDGSAAAAVAALLLAISLVVGSRRRLTGGRCCAARRP